jgi:hypothetical protein
MVLIRLEDYRKAQMLETELKEALTEVKKDDLEVKKRNTRFSPTSILVSGRVRPYRGGGGRNPTLPGGGR